jgi:hypothetical protein
MIRRLLSFFAGMLTLMGCEWYDEQHKEYGIIMQAEIEDDGKSWAYTNVMKDEKQDENSGFSVFDTVFGRKMSRCICSCPLRIRKCLDQAERDVIACMDQHPVKPDIWYCLHKFTRRVETCWTE